jgi:hypothetical protein
MNFSCYTDKTMFTVKGKDMRKIALFALISVLIAACQPTTPLEDLPTQVEFPTETNTPEASPTATNTNTPEPTETASHTPTETATATHTLTPTITLTASETPNATFAFSGTSTAAVIEAPRLSTLTPLPAGGISVIVARPTGTPEVMADLVITRPQFQEEMDLLLRDAPSISRARISFETGRGVLVDLTAEDNGVFVTGNVLVPFNFSGGSLNNIVIIGGGMEIEMSNEAEPSEGFLMQATNTVVLVQTAFNNILNQRLGVGDHNLESIVIQADGILVSLLVPQP